MDFRQNAKPTINDVARLAGVSIKTVSRVFNQEPNVRAETRDKVVAAAESLNYRPNLSARQLASNRTFLLGMLFGALNPEKENDYVMTLQLGALEVCQESGYHLLIGPCEADSPSLIDQVVNLSRQVAGFIVLQPLSDFEPLNEFLLENNIPCVRVSQRPFEGFPWVSVADADAADEMTEHLLELGHRRIGFIMGHPDHGQSHDRLEGYRRALKRWEIEYDADLVMQGRFDYRSGYDCAQSLISLPSAPTAIFASNDAAATGVLAAAHERGVSVPGELSVAGFDDSPLARHACPPITTVRQPIADVARTATQELIAQIQGRSEEISHQCLDAKLVCRASTASPARSMVTP